MLKARPTLFAPALPAAKRSAIGRLGFGVLDVVYLEYPERFWPKDRVSFGVAGEKCFPRFYDRSRFSGRPILSTGIGGDNARRLEGWSDSRIKAAAHKVLRGVFGPRIPPTSA